MDPVAHFEIPTDDMKRAEHFYHTVFGWQIQAMPEMKYTILRTGPTDQKTFMLEKPGMINGGMMMKNEDITTPVITISVSDMHKACEDIKKAGGHIVRESWTVGEMGFAAYFKDSEGNVMGLWQEKHKT